MHSAVHHGDSPATGAGLTAERPSGGGLKQLPGPRSAVSGVFKYFQLKIRHVANEKLSHSYFDAFVSQSVSASGAVHGSWQRFYQDPAITSCLHVYVAGTPSSAPNTDCGRSTLALCSMR